MSDNEKERGRPCDVCRKTRGRVELRTSIQRERSISLWTGPTSAQDHVLDTDCLEEEESVTYCFACYRDRHADRDLDAFDLPEGDVDRPVN